jgi:hypothetical protein
VQVLPRGYHSRSIFGGACARLSYDRILVMG